MLTIVVYTDDRRGGLETNRRLQDRNAEHPNFSSTATCSDQVCCSPSQYPAPTNMGRQSGNCCR
jgi:hypothetical protein